MNEYDFQKALRPPTITQTDKRPGESSEDARSRAMLTQQVANYHGALKQEQKLLNGIENNKDYECSAGMSNILKSISTIARLKNDSRKVFDVVILNVLTMVRNCYDRKKPDAKIVEDIRKDVNIFLQYIQSYFIEQKDMVEKPVVICYLPVYNIPEQFARPDTQIKKDLYKFANIVFGKQCTNPASTRELNNNAILYTVKAGIGMLPHQTIGRLITTKCDVGVLKPKDRRYLLISHCPIDLHLQNTLESRVFLLESFTGMIKSVNDFGKKVFKDDYVPFNQYTHLLLGDKVTIKPLIHHKDKTTLLEAAKKDMWAKKPLSVVLNEIKKLNFIPQETLKSVKF